MGNDSEGSQHIVCHARYKTSMLSFLDYDAEPVAQLFAELLACEDLRSLVTVCRRTRSSSFGDLFYRHTRVRWIFRSRQ